MRYKGDGHLITIAPTGAGKGRSSAIPALLTYPGSTLTIDLKGEAFYVTNRCRKKMGHRVIVLDPFRIVFSRPDTLNPFDLVKLPGGVPDVDSENLAELLCGGQPITSSDLFWERNGKGMIVGLIGLAMEHSEQRNLGAVLDYLYADEVDMTIAKALDDLKFHNKLARQELCAYLQHEGEKCRAGVRSTAQCILKCLGSQMVRSCLERTSFSLRDWMNGRPMDIYLVFPPDKLESHRSLLRLLLGTLLTPLMRRESIPTHRTLLILDEAAQFGTLSQLRTALTLLRGYGVQVWSMWQDLSQLRHLYPQDWETIMNNSAVLQVFGMPNGWAAKGVADILDMAVSDLLAMGPTRQAILYPGKKPGINRRVDYLTDQYFAGLFDANPRYQTSGGSGGDRRKSDLSQADGRSSGMDNTGSINR